MIKIFLFGSRDVYSIPKSVEDQLFNLLQENKENIQFIVGDASGVDSAFHKMLSAIGARRQSTIYCNDVVRNNKFDLPVMMFKSEFIEEENKVVLRNPSSGDELIFENMKSKEEAMYNRDYYFFKDRQMINECNMAVAVWDKKSKGTFTNINILKTQDKPVYVFTV